MNSTNFFLLSILLLYSFSITSCFSRHIVATKCNIDWGSVSKFWAEDECGGYGYRNVIYKSIVYGSEDYFVGKENIISFFPKPNAVDTSYEGHRIIISYLVETGAGCDDIDAAVQVMYINLDLKTNKVQGISLGFR